jgi:hypothetical protein
MNQKYALGAKFGTKITSSAEFTFNEAFVVQEKMCVFG